MNIQKNLMRCGALLAAVLALAPSALAADAETASVPAVQLIPAVRTVQTDWRLLLVNPWNTVPEGYEIQLATLSNGLQVDERIYDDLDDMLTDCREAGLSPIVCSAYRTEATQTRLYRNKVARVRASGVPEDQVEAEAARWVAPPGTSEHQTGLALDIVAASYQILDEKQEDTAEQKWLMENSWKYGFILRYPEEKSEITGIGYEPWHYRYVGRAAAWEMYSTGVCLEEFLQGTRPVAVTELVPAQSAALDPGSAECVRPPEKAAEQSPQPAAGQQAAGPLEDGSGNGAAAAAGSAGQQVCRRLSLRLWRG